ncbi:hypothetical protein K9M48_05600 [Candidatus Gracilibacteria bacterium]|nr:hypothetical protein [Candidatus Gracilibacteria bacterium]
MNSYENFINKTIKLSRKDIESLEKNGIYEFQNNELIPGSYDLCIHRHHQTDDIIMYLQKESVNHMFTFIIPSEMGEIKIGKDLIVIKFL